MEGDDIRTNTSDTTQNPADGGKVETRDSLAGSKMINQSEREARNRLHTIKNTVYYILGLIETLLAFRLLFKLLGARSGNPFVDFLYSITDVFTLPFAGIFRTLSSGTGTDWYVFEPSTVVAMIVYALIAKGVINLFKLRASHST